MRISKEIKELAKEIHEAEHRFVGDSYKDHKQEEYYYLLGAVVLKNVLDKIEEVNVEIYNLIVDTNREVRKLTDSMKEVSKQQKYLWETLEEGSHNKNKNKFGDLAK